MRGDFATRAGSIGQFAEFHFRRPGKLILRDVWSAYSLDVLLMDGPDMRSFKPARVPALANRKSLTADRFLRPQC